MSNKVSKIIVANELFSIVNILTKVWMFSQTDELRTELSNIIADEHILKIRKTVNSSISKKGKLTSANILDIWNSVVTLDAVRSCFRANIRNKNNSKLLCLYKSDSEELVQFYGRLKFCDVEFSNRITIDNFLQDDTIADALMFVALQV